MRRKRPTLTDMDEMSADYEWRICELRDIFRDATHKTPEEWCVDKAKRSQSMRSASYDPSRMVETMLINAYGFKHGLSRRTVWHDADALTLIRLSDPDSFFDTLG